MSRFLSFVKDNIFSYRRRVLATIMVVFSFILVSRLFVLQIIRGADYQNNYNLRIEREEIIPATRGNIYDRNGELIAYNKLAHAVTIEDTGTYISSKSKNELLNKELFDIIDNIEKNGDEVDTNFGIFINSHGEYEFKDSGSALQRFRADIFGHATVNELTYNSKAQLDEAEASADEIMAYLCGEKRYNIPKEYAKDKQLKVAIIRYKMGLNSYQKYISTVIANDVSDKTVAYIKENASKLEGANIAEKTLRVYEDAECFSNIIGYTGTISTEEYEELSKTDDSYSLNDVIGKAGIEQYLNTELMGKKGFQKIYVDSVGNLIDTAEHTDSKSGNNIYLSIDKKLQSNVYHLLEQEIAGILYSKIENIKEFNFGKDTKASEIVIPIYDVYYALLNNHLINADKLYGEEASDVEKAVAKAMDAKLDSVIRAINGQLNSPVPKSYNELEDEYQDYSTYIIKLLKNKNVIDDSLIDKNDATQIAWTKEELSVKEYLVHAIDSGWIDISSFIDDVAYVDSEEIYELLLDYISATLLKDNDFKMLVSKYAILEDKITGNQLCAILYDQGILEDKGGERDSILQGDSNAYAFLREKIRTLEINPGQLGLDPCTGSAVILDPNTGETLACVTYPGYDSNRLANNVDTDYFAYLSFNKSNPLYNHATQERTAPGSTFKPVTATAGLAEGVIDISTQIKDEGEYDKVDNKPKCWYYPQKHGLINVSEALRDSCNYFFYEVGYRLAGDTNYNDARGIERISNYASIFGLDEKTGVEVEEGEPNVATEYPVMASIGQSDNNYTTVSIGRYANAVANQGNVYDLTLINRIVDSEGNTLKEYKPQLRNQVNVLNQDQWDSIHYGMKMVVEELDTFKEFPVEVAGKTGTAQQVYNRPDHALFIGYAPYDKPQITVATRISYGYTSHNAADLCKYIMGMYFDVEGYEDSVDGTANDVSNTSNVTD